MPARAWQTTYFHVLGGEDPILEWMRGTTLRPILERLPADRHDAFLADLAALLREAYPQENGRTEFR